jgi:hypothetical protein
MDCCCPPPTSRRIGLAAVPAAVNFIQAAQFAMPTRWAYARGAVCAGSLLSRQRPALGGLLCLLRLPLLLLRVAAAWLRR